uniref:Uncharacterized protein n=1 Tax=Anguilla anguilla TaxID=7936 RepID=A0A0E9X474_ANGAN
MKIETSNLEKKWTVSEFTPVIHDIHIFLAVNRRGHSPNNNMLNRSIKLTEAEKCCTVYSVCAFVK